MDELTSRELSEWEAYDRLDPIGTWRDDYRMAFLSTLFTNLTISVHGKKGAKHAEVIDYMPDWAGEKTDTPKQQSVEDMKKILLGIAKVQNKKVEVKKEAVLKRKNKTIPK